MKIWGLQRKSGGLQRESKDLQGESGGLQQKYGVSIENVGVSHENLRVVSNEIAMGVSNERGLQEFSNDNDFIPDSVKQDNTPDESFLLVWLAFNVSLPTLASVNSIHSILCTDIMVDLGLFEFEPERPFVPALVMYSKYRPAGSVSTLMGRPDFLQYPAYHRPI